MFRVKKIDIHVHTMTGKGIGRIGSGLEFASPEQLMGMYRELGIEKGVILPEISVECAARIQSNEDAAAIAEKYKDWFYWFCNIDPRMGNNSPDTDLSYFLQYYKELGAKGVGEITANLYFDDPYVENLFYHCEKNEMPVLFHIGPQIGNCYGLVDEAGLNRLEKELAKFPGLKFIGHSQPFWAEIGTNVNLEDKNGYPTGKVNPGRVVSLMRKYPNLCGDLSAMSGYNALARDPEFGYGFIEEFQDRLYFGTDICTAGEYVKTSFWLDDAVDHGKISETAYKKVCLDNALKILELSKGDIP